MPKSTRGTGARIPRRSRNDNPGKGQGPGNNNGGGRPGRPGQGGHNKPGGNSGSAFSDFDTFTRANVSPEVGGITEGRGLPWTDLHGNWAITSNTLRGNVSGSGIEGFTDCRVVDTGKSDGVIQIDVVSIVANDRGAGLCFRVVDADNGWYAMTYRNFAGNAFLYVAKVTARANTYVVNGLALAAYNATVKVRVNGANGEVFVNDVSKGTWSDATHVNATKHGVVNHCVTSTVNILDNWSFTFPP